MQRHIKTLTCYKIENADRRTSSGVNSLKLTKKKNVNPQNAFDIGIPIE